MKAFFRGNIGYYSKLNFIKKIFVGAVVLSLFFACGKNPEVTPPPPGPPPPGNCSGPAKSFAADVNPIIQNNCTSSGCHGAGSGNGPGPLLTFDQIKNAASMIKTSVVNKTMPRGGSLSSTQIQTISCWVDNGAPNN